MRTCYSFPGCFPHREGVGFGRFEFDKSCRSLDELGIYFTVQTPSLKFECKCAVALTSAGRNAFPGHHHMVSVRQASQKNCNRVVDRHGRPPGVVC